MPDRAVFTRGVAIGGIVWSVAASFGATPSAQVLLKDADRARGGLEKGVTWTIEIESFEGADISKREFDVRARGDDALAQATAPTRNKGEVFLFNDRMMWFYKPGLRKPVGLNARQKLTGEAANGDIASTQYARDYEGTVLKAEEKIDGKSTVVLDLKAKKKNVTYDRIRYWISKDEHLGIKAEFQSLDGVPIKLATFDYKNTLTADGKTFPFVSTMTIADAKKPENKSIIRYGKPQAKEISAAEFNVNKLIQ